MIRVYPRGCGGTICGAAPGACGRGLSPRVRGNRAGWRRGGHGAWSIPAGAGEPLLAYGLRLVAWVYPRGCGGTNLFRRRRRWRGGLSPRVRGNPRGDGGGREAAGSIPAGAGEPPSRTGRRSCRWVYPRGCGGTLCAAPPSPLRMGLSPRVRGNQRRLVDLVLAVGSIPAGAGEPERHCRHSARSWVYPRGCGGTRQPAVRPERAAGLSPRVRGNLVIVRVPSQPSGSIPAGAGEPRGGALPGQGRGVYPRGCGGTVQYAQKEASHQGLSPRVRGNPHAEHHLRLRVGSIPAGAGEPCKPSCRGRGARVYPRGCGGTVYLVFERGRGQGLSPRVRGNLNPDLDLAAVPGSIPAGAGEPLAILADSPARVEALPSVRTTRT